MKELAVNTLCRVVAPGKSVHGVLCFTRSLRKRFNFHWAKEVTTEEGYMIKLVGQSRTTAHGLPIGVPETMLEPCLGNPDAEPYSRAQIWQPKKQVQQ